MQPLTRLIHFSPVTPAFDLANGAIRIDPQSVCLAGNTNSQTQPEAFDISTMEFRAHPPSCRKKGTGLAFVHGLLGGELTLINRLCLASNASVCLSVSLCRSVCVCLAA